MSARLLDPKMGDAWLFGWDLTSGIVSVWADRSGRALVWQRDGTLVRCTEERFHPWLFAATLAQWAERVPAQCACSRVGFTTGT